MKSQWVLVAIAATALQWGTFTDCHALALGDLHGTVMIGRPLDVTVSVMPGPDDDLSASCVSADVYYADTRQSAPRLSLSLPSDPLKQTARVRVQQPDIINEPVVTVLLRTTCGAVHTRRYVMLADVPAIPQLDGSASRTVAESTPPAVVVLPVQPPATPPDPLHSASTTPPAPAKVHSASHRAPASRSAPAVPAPVTTSSTLATSAISSTPSPASVTANAQRLAPTAARPAPAPPPTGKSRLQLDPLEVMSDRMDSLGSFMQFAPTEDALQQSRQIASLQADLKAMRDLMAKNDARHEARLQALQMQWQSQLKSQSQQAPIWLIYGLTGLVLVCLGAVVWVVRQQRDIRAAWWHDGDDSAMLAPTEIDAHHSDLPDARSADPSTPTQPDALHDLQHGAEPPHVVPSAVRPPTQSRPMPHPAAPADPAAPPHPVVAATPQASAKISHVHHLNVESILDLRQQAEFFVSLGQTDRASGILRQQLTESAEPHPLVYLDLLALYHSLGLRSDFDAMRSDLEQHFRVRVPVFANFADEGRLLETYPDVLSEVSLCWPSVDAVAFLDACIYADPAADDAPPFDLAAFRELLMLHILAEDVVTDLPPPSARIPVQTAVDAASSTASARVLQTVSPALPRLATVAQSPHAPDIPDAPDAPDTSQPSSGMLPPLMPIDLPSMLSSFSTDTAPDAPPVPHVGSLPDLPDDAPLFTPEMASSSVQPAAPLPSLASLTAPAAPAPEEEPAMLPTPVPVPVDPPPAPQTADEAPVRMLDLDFSALWAPPVSSVPPEHPAQSTDATLPATDTTTNATINVTTDVTPPNKTPVRYATRSRWSAHKKS